MEKTWKQIAFEAFERFSKKENEPFLIGDILPDDEIKCGKGILDHIREMEERSKLKPPISLKEASDQIRRALAKPYKRQGIVIYCGSSSLDYWREIINTKDLTFEKMNKIHEKCFPSTK